MLLGNIALPHPSKYLCPIIIIIIIILLNNHERVQVHNMHSSIFSENVTSECPLRNTMCNRTPVGGLSVETPARGGMSLPSVELSAGISVAGHKIMEHSIRL
jgi:hypothetical protein